MSVRNYCNRDGHDGIVRQCVDYGYTVETLAIDTVGPIGPRHENIVLRSSRVYNSDGALVLYVWERCAGRTDITGYSDYVYDIRVEIDVP